MSSEEDEEDVESFVIRGKLRGGGEYVAYYGAHTVIYTSTEKSGTYIELNEVA